uniref:YqaJ viral recombinase domain-containing protein n=1 Tax=Amphimedon queenslandica TaxID=400682 RepID=A0A1X7T8P7_AMPQE
MDHRKGRITASKVHSILKCRASKYPTSIVKGIMQYYAPNDFVPSLQWGRQHEDDARQQYITVLQQQHRNLQTSSSGLIIDPAIPFMGASPDGFSTCDCCGERTIEIKCPFSMRNVFPTADIALANPTYCLKKDDHGKVSLSKRHGYYTQIQSQLLISHQKKCDFICWTPHGLFCETIHEDKQLQDEIVSKCKESFLIYVLPEILTQRLKDTGVPVSNDQKYCYCKR